MKYHITASELAVITGHNQYRDIQELYIKLWKKYHKTDFENIKDRVKKSQGSVVLPEKASESVKRLAKEHKIKASDVTKLFAASKEKNTNNMNSVRKEALDSMLKQVPEAQKELLKKAANSVAFTNFGTRNEYDGVELFREHRNVDVERPTGYFSQELFILGETPDTWSIGGKIDGIFSDDDGTRAVLEIKNRMRGLFNKVRDYEKVQCYAYMFCLDLKHTSLAEIYKSEQGVKMGVIDIGWEDDFWENEVVVPVSDFVEDFYDFMEDESRRIEIIS